MIAVPLVEEHATKELGAGSFTPRFLQLSVVMELFVWITKPSHNSSYLSLGLYLYSVTKLKYINLNINQY